MLAQVFTIQAKSTEDWLEDGKQLGASTRQLEGCEGILLLANSSGGMGIALWRDQESMDAAATKIRRDVQIVSDKGVVITPSDTFDTVVSI